MPSLNDIANITILTAAAQVSRKGFGTALIFGGAAAAKYESALTTLYASPDEMIAKGYLATDPEYLAAVALKAQTPCPVNFKIGKRSNLPTQAITVTPTAKNLTAYSAVVDGLTATYTSDASGTVAEIVTGLKAAIDALAPSAWVKNHAYTKGDKVSQSGRRYTCITTGTSENSDSGGPTKAGNDVRSKDTTDGSAHWKFVGIVPTVTDGTTYLGVASPIAGEYFDFVVADFNLLRAQQSHADNAAATDLASIALADSDWYALVDCFPSFIAGGNGQTPAVVAWVESAGKIHGFSATDGGIPSAATDDVMTWLMAAGYTRTFGMFHPDASQFFDAAWFGARLPLDPGSETWAYCKLAGITAVQMTPAQQNYCTGAAATAYATGKACNIYVVIGGIAATWPGLVGAREFIDKVRGIDALKDEAQVDVYERIVSASSAGSKIPFTDAGISVIKAALAKALKKFSDLGFLTPGSTFVTAPAAADVASLDKQARVLTGVKAGGTIAGAVHELVATITLTY